MPDPCLSGIDGGDERLSSSYRCGWRRVFPIITNLTGNSRRTVEISEDFRVTVNEDGRLVVPAQLSHGARDQLYIALRLGIARLLAERQFYRSYFDDPFLNCDEARLGNIRYSLNSWRRSVRLSSYPP